MILKSFTYKNNNVDDLEEVFSIFESSKYKSNNKYLVPFLMLYYGLKEDNIALINKVLNIERSSILHKSRNIFIVLGQINEEVEQVLSCLVLIEIVLERASKSKDYSEALIQFKEELIGNYDISVIVPSYINNNKNFAEMINLVNKLNEYLNWMDDKIFMEFHSHNEDGIREILGVESSKIMKPLVNSFIKNISLAAPKIIVNETESDIKDLDVIFGPDAWLTMSYHTGWLKEHIKVIEDAIFEHYSIDVDNNNIDYEQLQTLHELGYVNFVRYIKDGVASIKPYIKASDLSRGENLIKKLIENNLPIDDNQICIIEEFLKGIRLQFDEKWNLKGSEHSFTDGFYYLKDDEDNKYFHLSTLLARLFKIIIQRDSVDDKLFSIVDDIFSDCYHYKRLMWMSLVPENSSRLFGGDARKMSKLSDISFNYILKDTSKNIDDLFSYGFADCESIKDPLCLLLSKTDENIELVISSYDKFDYFYNACGGDTSKINFRFELDKIFINGTEFLFTILLGNHNDEEAKVEFLKTINMLEDDELVSSFNLMYLNYERNLEYNLEILRLYQKTITKFPVTVNINNYILTNVIELVKICSKKGENRITTSVCCIINDLTGMMGENANRKKILKTLEDLDINSECKTVTK